MLQGHLNYFAVSGNHPSLWWFFNQLKRLWCSAPGVAHRDGRGGAHGARGLHLPVILVTWESHSGLSTLTDLTTVPAFGAYQEEVCACPLNGSDRQLWRQSMR